jgi:hypothetical protein
LLASAPRTPRGFSRKELDVEEFDMKTVVAELCTFVAIALAIFVAVWVA